jgi:hypothetical protein
MKMFGQYVVEDNAETLSYSPDAEDVGRANTKTKTYVKTGNTVNIAYTSHGLSVNDKVRIEFTSGGMKNVKNGIYTVTSVSTNNFLVVQPRSPVATINIVNPGRGYNANSYIVFSLENSQRANANYNVNASGSIVSVNISDYGAYYSTSPTATANGSNSVPATFTVTLNHYANSTSGSANVSYYS